MKYLLALFLLFQVNAAAQSLQIVGPGDSLILTVGEIESWAALDSVSLIGGELILEGSLWNPAIPGEADRFDSLQVNYTTGLLHFRNCYLGLQQGVGAPKYFELPLESIGHNSLKLTNCRLDGGGVYSYSSHFDATDCVFLSRPYGVFLSNPAGEAALENCRFAFCDTAIVVRQGILEMNQGALVSNTLGILASGGSQVTMRSVTIQSNRQAVSFQDSSMLILIDTDIQETRDRILERLSLAADSIVNCYFEVRDTTDQFLGITPPFSVPNMPRIPPSSAEILVDVDDEEPLMIDEDSLYFGYRVLLEDAIDHLPMSPRILRVYLSGGRDDDNFEPIFEMELDPFELILDNVVRISLPLELFDNTPADSLSSLNLIRVTTDTEWLLNLPDQSIVKIVPKHSLEPDF